MVCGAKIKLWQKSNCGKTYVGSVTISGVETCRDHHQIWLELSCNRQEHVPEGSNVLDITHGLSTAIRGPSNVHVLALASLLTTLVRSSRERIKVSIVPAVERYVQDVGVLVEDLLRAIAVTIGRVKKPQ